MTNPNKLADALRRIANYDPWGSDEDEWVTSFALVQKWANEALADHAASLAAPPEQGDVSACDFCAGTGYLDAVGNPADPPAPQPAPAPVQVYDVCPRCSSAWEPSPVSMPGGAMDRCSNADCANMRWARPRASAPSSEQPCQTCNGHGMIGGPSYREPDEGGEPCPDCAHPPAPAADGALPPLPQAFFDEFGKGADDRVQDYARAAIAALRQPVPDAVRELPAQWRKWGRITTVALRRVVLNDCAAELESAIASQQESRK